jgi:uncharacterized protein
VEPSLEQRIVDVFARREGVVAVYLFGSMVRGTAKPDSDVDVAVLFTSPPPQRLDGPRLVIEGELERTLGRTVDLIVLNDVPVDLRIRVLRDGRLLIDRDRTARIAFEVQTRNEAFDLEPVLTRYRTEAGARRDGWLDEGLAGTLRNMAGFRNVLVHGYDDVDLEVVTDILSHHLGDLDAFVAAVRRRRHDHG